VILLVFVKRCGILVAKEKAAAPDIAGVTASVDTVSLKFRQTLERSATGTQLSWNYGLNFIFLVVTSAAVGNPSWILSFSISP
jgi:hypothetical protein